MKPIHILPPTLAALLGLLSACAQQTPSTPASATPPLSAGGDCSAAGAQFALGRIADATLVEQARQRSGARMARVIRPGQPVTMDFNSQRLNLDIDAASVVKRAHCG